MPQNNNQSIETDLQEAPLGAQSTEEHNADTTGRIEKHDKVPRKAPKEGLLQSPSTKSNVRVGRLGQRQARNRQSHVNLRRGKSVSHSSAYDLFGPDAQPQSNQRGHSVPPSPSKGEQEETDSEEPRIHLATPTRITLKPHLATHETPEGGISKLDLPDIVQLEDPFAPEQDQREGTNNQSQAPYSSAPTGSEAPQSPKVDVSEVNVPGKENDDEPQGTSTHLGAHVPKKNSSLSSTNDNPKKHKSSTDAPPKSLLKEPPKSSMAPKSNHEASNLPQNIPRGACVAPGFKPHNTEDNVNRSRQVTIPPPPRDPQDHLQKNMEAKR